MYSRSKFQKLFSSFRAGAIALTIISTFLTSIPASAKNAQSDVQSLDAFIESVRTGDGSALTGVFVRDVMALPIVQQPAGSPGYVSSQNDVFTQFGMASQFGSTGLLAHNYLAGQYLPMLTSGTEIVLVYGDGRLEYYRVTSVLQYQALDPLNPYSNFRDLSSDTILAAADLFNLVYRSDGRLVLQTCIEQNGNSSWGRLFIVAEPEVWQDANEFISK